MASFQIDIDKAHQQITEQAEVQEFLLGLSRYFLEILPSELDDSFILKVEPLLLKYAQIAFDEQWDDEIEQIISKALAHIAAVCYHIKQIPMGWREEKCFNTIRKVGKILSLI